MGKPVRVFPGARFRKLTVIEQVGWNYVGKNNKPVRRWRCRCECGNEVEVTSPSLTCRGGSCGCLREARHEFMRKIGMHRKYPMDYNYRVERNTLNMMMQRCHSPKNKCYDRYGGKGITVCDRWNVKTNKYAIANFIADMGRRPHDKHTIDRIDNNKGYSPDNCRWASYSENNLNRDFSNFKAGAIKARDTKRRNLL